MKHVNIFLIALLIALFIFYEKAALSRLLGEHYLKQGLSYIKDDRRVWATEPVEKSLSYQRALRLMSRSILENPYFSKGYFEYAELLQEIAKDPGLRISLGTKDASSLLDAARIKYTEAIKREPVNAIYHQRLGDVYYRLGDDKEAEREFDNAVLLDPQNASIHFYLSKYFFIKNKDEDFLYHINKAISLGGGGEIINFLKSIKREDLIPKSK